jgi:hypothetical protein
MIWLASFALPAAESSFGWFPAAYNRMRTQWGAFALKFIPCKVESRRQKSHWNTMGYLKSHELSL